MSDLLSRLRSACAEIAARSQSVAVVHGAIAAYARGLPLDSSAELRADPDRVAGSSEQRAAFWLTLDAINFGSGWFPTLRKPDGRSGYATIAAGLRARFAARGPWKAAELAVIEPREIAAALGQAPEHELMGLFSYSLRDLGSHVETGYGGSFQRLLDAADRSALKLVTTLAGWDCYADRSTYASIEVPFLKRAQIAAADLSRAGLCAFDDLERLTMFADNLVPHVLRLDGVLEYDSALLARIERGELIAHGAREEVEIRACALHAVELIVAARGRTSAAEVDQLLWQRGQAVDYKAVPRHRCRCTAY